MISIKINDIFVPGALTTGKQLKEAGFTKLYKVMRDNDTHYNMHYKEGENTDVLPFNPTGYCERGGLYFATVDEIFRFSNYGDYIREVTISDGEPIYVEHGKLKAHTICLGERTPLWNTKTFSRLINEGADIHTDDDYAFRRAAYCGHLKIIKFLVSTGIDVHFWYDCALCTAAERGYLEIVKFLVSVGANIYAADDYALCMAAEYGHLKAVQFLVSEGADVHAREDDALYLATANGHYEIANFLISAGADVSVLTEAQKRKLSI